MYWVGQIIHASGADYLFWLDWTVTTSTMVRSCLLPFSSFLLQVSFVAENAKKEKILN
jgi:hypothetical protein